MEITAEYVRSILHYDPETGVCTWTARVARCIRIGARAGTLHPSGYWNIAIKGRRYALSRIIVLWVTGKLPERDIDHEDLDKGNNRWRNLREATESQNAANRSIFSTNTSGFKGVSFCKRNGKWQASIRVNDKSVWLGYFTSPEAAHAAYAAAAKRYFGEFMRAA